MHTHCEVDGKDDGQPRDAEGRSSASRLGVEKGGGPVLQFADESQYRNSERDEAREKNHPEDTSVVVWHGSRFLLQERVHIRQLESPGLRFLEPDLVHGSPGQPSKK